MLRMWVGMRHSQMHPQVQHWLRGALVSSSNRALQVVLAGTQSLWLHHVMPRPR